MHTLLFRAKKSSYIRVITQSAIVFVMISVGFTLFLFEIDLRKPQVVFAAINLPVAAFLCIGLSRCWIYRLRIVLSEQDKIVTITETLLFSNIREFAMPVCCERVISTNGGFAPQLKINDQFYFGSFLDEPTQIEICHFLQKTTAM